MTTRHSGKRRRICSPSESLLQTDSAGGMPCEKSSGLATSIATLPSRCFAAAASPGRDRRKRGRPVAGRPPRRRYVSYAYVSTVLPATTETV